MTGLLRVFGMLYMPQQTFESIRAKPTFVVALIVLMLAGAAANVVLAPKIDYGQAISAEMEKRGQELSEDELEQAVSMMEKFGWVFGLVGVLIVQPVALLLVAAVFWGAFKLLGSEMGFKTSLATTVHAMVPMLLATLLMISLGAGRENLTQDELAGGMVMSNLGFLADEDSSPVVKAALRGIDFFSLWILALLVIGYRMMAGVDKSKATALVIVLWLVWFVGKIGWAGIFG